MVNSNGLHNGFKVYKTFNNVKLIKIGFNAYDTRGNTQLGKLINQCKKEKELNGCIVWYTVNNDNSISIVYKKA